MKEKKKSAARKQPKYCTLPHMQKAFRTEKASNKELFSAY